MNNEIFHDGELTVQRKLGVERQASRLKRMVAPAISPQIVPFIETQALIFVGSTDATGQPWSSALYGEPGFLQVPESTELVIDQEMIKSPKGDMFFANIETNPEVGFLFIHPESRTRFRVNGYVTRLGRKIKVRVGESYGNCPNYIQAGNLVIDNTFDANRGTVFQGSALDDRGLEMISRSNTFYVSSRNTDGRTDTSHRGGNDGFVSVTPEGNLMIPDYPGNNLFNTLGNIHQYPRTGLLFMDHDNGTVLQLAGEARVLYDSDSKKQLTITGGTGVFWIFRPIKWIRTEGHFNGTWNFHSYSPFNPKVE
ncbi:pyridoxamine 5'-phosphate oxidase family protein [Muricauda sp. CAU 1633]|uniref:pyridoxamine 5'-phosphate oxidase family protein n=1 Tax=Allomuricauda sp. CAU 1633 TaxID=2816036 RepID=UPI001A8F7198|nr:pyridoxamine 5'-phosphate oxidase family protein [Muricauda sp. CAU 1633]MBO0322243.1 pyridoxamine 5'-phosphate oxidase family protein [Muricauda sp. CAU 1633]